MSLGPPLLQCLSEGWGQIFTALRNQRAPGWQPKAGTSTGLLVVTDPLTASGPWTQTAAQVSGGITSYSQQALPHYPGLSGSASLRCAHILLPLFLPFLHCSLLLVSPRVSEGLRSPWEIVSGVPLPTIMVPGREIILSTVSTPRPVWGWTGSPLRLAPCLGPMTQVWCSFILGLLFTRCAQVTPCESHLSQAHSWPGPVVPDGDLLVLGVLPWVPDWVLLVPEW